MSQIPSVINLRPSVSNNISMESIILPNNNFEIFKFGKNAPPGYVTDTAKSYFKKVYEIKLI